MSSAAPVRALPLPPSGIRPTSGRQPKFAKVSFVAPLIRYSCRRPTDPQYVEVGSYCSQDCRRTSWRDFRPWRRSPPPAHSALDWHSLFAFRITPAVPITSLEAGGRVQSTGEHASYSSPAASATGVIGMEIAAAGAKLAPTPNCRSCSDPWRKVRVNGYLEV